MKTFMAWARTESGKDIGRFKVKIDTDEPLSQGDVLTLEDECDELGN